VGRRPESGLLALRKELDLYINLRPIELRASLQSLSPLRSERAKEVRIDIIRELAGDIYFGEHRTEGTGSAERATDQAAYTTGEIERISHYAFRRAEARTGRLASVDKANVLATSQLWRRTVTRLAAAYPRVRLEHLYVDNAAMQLVARAGAVRRHPYLESVRRYPQRPWGGASGLDRADPLDELRPGPVALRAHPRLGAVTRWKRRGFARWDRSSPPQ